MKITGVYLLTDEKTKKFYVGSSGDVKKRLKRHIYDLNRNQHHCGELQDLWWENRGLVPTIFPTSTREEAYTLEKDIISRFSKSNLMLNVGLGVKGGDNLSRNKNRDEIVDKIKNSVRGRMMVLSLDERRVLFGRPGEKNGMWGRKHTEEAKRIMSKAAKAGPIRSGYTLVLTDEQRQNRSTKAKNRTGELNPFYGKVHSEETKKRISEKKKTQNLLPPNTRKVMIEGKVYVSLSEASRQLGVSPALIVYKINSNKERYVNYCYIT